MRFLLTIITFALLGFAASLAWFVQAMPTKSTPPSVKTDAIIVLTGGADRVERGLAMVGAGAAPVLFISGVGQHVSVGQMVVAHADRTVQMQIAQRQPQIILDYIANTTQTNAEQSLEFVRARKLKSIRLVTAHYHMQRSLLVFRRAMPGVSIVPDAVFPEGFHRDEWWQHDNTRRLMFSEYYKYYGALLRIEKQPLS